MIIHNEIEFYDIPGLEGKLAVSKCGLVYSYFKDGIKSQNIDRDGYLTISINTNKNYNIRIFVHRLIAKTFLHNPDNLPCVNHIDGNKANNNILNLEWTTYRDNILHAIANGLNCPSNAKKRRFSEEEKREIIRLYQCGVSCRKLSKIYNISVTTISRVIKRINALEENTVTRLNQ